MKEWKIITAIIIIVFLLITISMIREGIKPCLEYKNVCYETHSCLKLVPFGKGLSFLPGNCDEEVDCLQKHDFENKECIKK